jgi:hypothetical protein
MLARVIQYLSPHKNNIFRSRLTEKKSVILYGLRFASCFGHSIDYSCVLLYSNYFVAVGEIFKIAYKIDDERLDRVT